MANLIRSLLQRFICFSCPTLRDVTSEEIIQRRVNVRDDRLVQNRIRLGILLYLRLYKNLTINVTNPRYNISDEVRIEQERFL